MTDPQLPANATDSPLHVWGGAGGGVPSIRQRRYPVIVADPPWHFVTYSNKGQGKGAQQHYPTMSVDEIASLPVSRIAAANCILLLWATWPNIQDALRVGAAWGFEFKTLAFDWVKRSSTGKSLHTGLGYYTRSNSEPCLLFRRGKMPELKSRSVHQVIETDENPGLPGFEEVLSSRIAAHSKKPEEFYHRVEQLLDGPYLELFSRLQRPGWQAIGDEIDGQDISAALLCEIESLLEDKP